MLRIKVGNFWIPITLEGRHGELYVEDAMCYNCAGENVYVELYHDPVIKEDHYWLKCEDCRVTMKVQALEL